MHHRRVELHNSVRVRQTAEADTVIKRIQFDDVHALDNGVQHIVAFRNHRVRFLHARHVAAILEPIAIRRRDHQRLNGLRYQNRRRPAFHGTFRREHNAGRGAADHEITTFHLMFPFLLLES